MAVNLMLMFFSGVFYSCAKNAMAQVYHNEATARPIC